MDETKERTQVKDLIEFLKTLDPDAELSVDTQWYNPANGLHYDRELNCVFN